MASMEVVEVIHSFVRPAQQSLKRMTSANREDTLHFMFLFWNEEHLKSLPGNDVFK
jgi:hypothetical protein